MNLWNTKNLLPPPTNTYKTVSRELDLTKLRNAILDGIKHFKDEGFMAREAAILSRIIYRMKMKFRSAKDFKSLEKVNHALNIYFEANMRRDLSNILDVIPSNYYGDTYLPTRNMLSYILVRIQGLVKLMERIYDTCKIAASQINTRFFTGHFWKIAFIAFAVISRISVLVKYNTKFLCEFHGKLLPHSNKLRNKGKNWLPEGYVMPDDLREWLGVRWVYEDEYIDLTLEETPKIFDFFDLENDEDDDIQFCDEYVLIDEEDLEIVNEFKKLQPMKDDLRNRMRGFSISEEDLGEEITDICDQHNAESVIFSEKINNGSKQAKDIQRNSSFAYYDNVSGNNNNEKLLLNDALTLNSNGSNDHCITLTDNISYTDDDASVIVIPETPIKERNVNIDENVMEVICIEAENSAIEDIDTSDINKNAEELAEENCALNRENSVEIISEEILNDTFVDAKVKSKERSIDLTQMSVEKRKRKHTKKNNNGSLEKTNIETSIHETNSVLNENNSSEIDNSRNQSVIFMSESTVFEANKKKIKANRIKKNVSKKKVKDSLADTTIKTKKKTRLKDKNINKLPIIKRKDLSESVNKEKGTKKISKDLNGNGSKENQTKKSNGLNYETNSVLNDNSSSEIDNSRNQSVIFMSESTLFEGNKKKNKANKIKKNVSKKKLKDSLTDTIEKNNKKTRLKDKPLNELPIIKRKDLSGSMNKEKGIKKISQDLTGSVSKEKQTKKRKISIAESEMSTPKKKLKMKDKKEVIEERQLFKTGTSNVCISPFTQINQGHYNSLNNEDETIKTSTPKIKRSNKKKKKHTINIEGTLRQSRGQSFKKIKKYNNKNAVKSADISASVTPKNNNKAQGTGNYQGVKKSKKKKLNECHKGTSNSKLSKTIKKAVNNLRNTVNSLNKIQKNFQNFVSANMLVNCDSANKVKNIQNSTNTSKLKTTSKFQQNMVDKIKGLMPKDLFGIKNKKRKKK